MVSWWRSPSHDTCPIERATASVTSPGHKAQRAATTDESPMIKNMSNPRNASSDIKRSFFILYKG